MAFERFRQGVKMPITTYYARKVAVFRQAVPNAGDSQFWYLKQHMMKGIFNPYMRLNLPTFQHLILNIWRFNIY